MNNFDIPVYGEVFDSITGKTIETETYENGETTYISTDGTKSGSTKLDAMGVTEEQMVDLLIEKMASVDSQFESPNNKSVRTK